MKTQKQSLHLLAIFFTLFTGTILTSRIHAQSQPEPDGNRVLLIFDTSSDMKKRLPAEEMGIKKLFALSFSTQLHRGDSIGVWTFDRDLRMGEFPLQQWQPEDMDIISSNIFKFIQKHRYSKTTSFDQLIPTLERLVASSPRLTTLIFCDGETPIAGTPFDASINSVFRQNQDKMKKVREPFVIVLCSIDGRYVGSTINTAESINVPQALPALKPAPPPPLQAPSVPVEAPTPSAPPLVIIGTNVGTNIPPPTPPPVVPRQPPAPVPQSTPPPAAPAATSEAAPADSSPMIIVTPTSTPVPESNSASQTITSATLTNTVVLSPNSTNSNRATAMVIDNPGISKNVSIAIGGAVFIVAFMAGYFILRPRRRRSSLISESLKKR